MYTVCCKVGMAKNDYAHDQFHSTLAAADAVLWFYFSALGTDAPRRFVHSLPIW